jgi:hypothetical protein
MPGTFSKSNRPTRTGGYTNFDSTAITAIQASVGSTVAVPITHDWGPFKVPTLCASYSEFLARFGSGATTGRRDAKQVFQGEDFDGRQGAGAAIIYRTGTAAAAKATAITTNTTPASAITVTALYEGTKGNTITTQSLTMPDGSRDYAVSVGGLEVERYNHLATDLNALAALVNASSPWIRIAVTLSGVALIGTVTTLSGGNDGASLTGTEYTALQGALEFERFGIFVTSQADPTILASFKTWAVNRNAAGQRFLMVTGGNGSAGVGSETMITANTRSGTLNDPHFINVGGFYVTDEVEGLLSPAAAAPRIAGIFAARGRSRSLSLARVRGWTLTTAPTSAEVDTAYTSGTLTLARDSNPVAPVYIEKGLTTYTTKSSTSRPYKVYRNPKFVLTMTSLETELAAYAMSPGIIGELGVNDKTRAAIVGDAVARLTLLEAQNVVQAGWTVGVDTDPLPSNDDEFVALRYSLRFARTVEQIYNTIIVA